MDIAKQVRDTIKNLGYNARQVSVKKDGGSVKVTIKVLEAAKDMKRIESAVSIFEDYQTDISSGEILSGGNTFIFVGIDWKFQSKMIEAKRSELDELYKVIEYKNNRINKFEDKEVIYMKDANYPCLYGIKEGENIKMYDKDSFEKNLILR